MSRPPTRPSFTRSHSSSPIGESTLRLITASTVCGGALSRPSIRSSNGFRKSSDVTTAEAG